MIFVRQKVDAHGAVRPFGTPLADDVHRNNTSAANVTEGTPWFCKKNRLLGLAVVLACGAALPRISYASVWEKELTADEQAQVAAGSMVVHLEDMPDSAWPMVTIYRQADATPEQVAAVFSDYDLHKVMFRDKDGTGIVESTPHCTADPAVCDIDYLQTFPKVGPISIPSQRFTTHNTLTTKEATPYHVDWYRTKSTSLIKDIKGQFRVETMPSGVGSLVIYMQWITPDSPIAGSIKKRAIAQVKQSAQSLIEQVKNEIAQNPGKLEQQIAVLRQIVGQ